MRASLLTLATAGLAVGAVVSSWMAMVTPAPTEGVVGPALVVAAGGHVTGAVGPTGDAVPASIGEAWADPGTGSSPAEVTSRATPTATVPRTVSPARVRALDVDSDDAPTDAGGDDRSGQDVGGATRTADDHDEDDPKNDPKNDPRNNPKNDDKGDHKDDQKDDHKDDDEDDE